MKNREEVEKQVLDAIQHVSCDENAKLNQDFRQDLGFDSLDAVELMMEVEKNLNMAIPDDVAETFANGNQIVDYICSLQD